jgi:hypothetical protein
MAAVSKIERPIVIRCDGEGGGSGEVRPGEVRPGRRHRWADSEHQQSVIFLENS